MFPDAPILWRDRPPRFAEAGDLLPVGPDVRGRDARLAAPAAEAWLRLRAAAAADDQVLVLISAFRSIAEQAEIIRRKRARGLAWETILRVNAYPGFSEHHTGRAIDLGTPGSVDLSESFENTPAFAWLQARAGMFGFRLSYPRDNPAGIAYEPWHWMWHPASGTAPESAG